MSIRDEQPEVPRCQRRRIGHEVQQPELGRSRSIGLRRHFTVTVIASLVERYSGWYIGSTRVGLTRKTPGLTTFSRYTYSCCPCGKYMLKNVMRSSRSSRSLNQRAHHVGCSSSAYRSSRAIDSVPDGIGSSIIR